MNTRSVLPPLALLMALALPSLSAEFYSHGNPTAEEQFMLELINRARAAPAAEGLFLAGTKDPDTVVAIDYFNVDLARVKREFGSYSVHPPLAFNPSLLASSRVHSKDMAENNFQAHTGSNGSTIGSRFSDAGYNFASGNESIYSNLVPTVLFGHCGLNIDWGIGPGGVQAGLGHRMNIMGTGPIDYREVGISVVYRSGSSATKHGKLAITQDFGNRVGSPAFLLGVAYYDANNNGICDPGEGLSGIDVQPASGSFYSRTSASGGYAIPFPVAFGGSSVTFSGGGLAGAVKRQFAIISDNAKVDLRITSGGPFVNLEKVDGIASERGKRAGGDALFRIVRVGPISKAATIILTRPTSGGTGTALPADYLLSAVRPATMKKIGDSTAQFKVVIPKNQRFAEINIVAVADKLAEPTEMAGFTLVDSSAYHTGSSRSVEILIVK